MSSRAALALEDEFALRTLLARYGHLADSGTPEFATLFAEDGTWTRLNSGNSGAGGTGLPPETIRGRADIVQKMMVEVVQQKFRCLLRHQLTDVYVEAGDTPDDALGHARALITDWRDGPGRISMFATYHARFARVKGTWLIQAMTCSLLPS